MATAPQTPARSPQPASPDLSDYASRRDAKLTRAINHSKPPWIRVPVLDHSNSKLRRQAPRHARGHGPIQVVHSPRASNRVRGTRIDLVTTKEQLHQLVDELSEEEAASARIVVEGPEAEAEMASLPEGWSHTITGEPMPNVAAAVRRSRNGH